MPIIHAYRRSAPISVDLEGQDFKFSPNESGHIVCDVPAGPAADRLLEIADGYREYSVAPADPQTNPDAELASPYLLTQEGDNGEEETVDLRTLSLEQLQEFAKANEIEFHHKLGADKLRDKIVDFFKV